MQTLWKYLFIISIFRLTVHQIQQTFHLKGNKIVEELQVYGTTGVYSKGNTIGGKSGSTSFLINDNKEMILLFGGSNFGASDQVWKFSLQKKEWMFLKGRKSANQLQSYNLIGVFEEENQIGSRYDANSWMNKEENGDLITIFGGRAYLNENSKDYCANDLWRYNISSNSYQAIFPRLASDDFRTKYSGNLGEFANSNFPAGRKTFVVVTLDEDETLLMGGYGYFSDQTKGNLGDWNIFSYSRTQWKYLGGKFNQEESIVMGDTNVYHPDNNFGSRSAFSGIKINSEEVLFFGGDLFISNSISRYVNVMHKYNKTSNSWKKVGGNINGAFGVGYSREYDDFTYPGSREDHKMFLKNEKEVLLIAGHGQGKFTPVSITNRLSDEFTYNIQSNKWKFSGKETSIYPGRHIVSVQNEEEEDLYSEYTSFGGICNFVGQFNPLKNELIICGGYGNGKFNLGYLEDCWRIYYGNICGEYQETDSRVCSGRGNCGTNGICDCEPSFFGSNCELSKCEGVLSNETEMVCSQKGVCIDSKCLCYESSPYNNLDCSVNANLEQFMDYLWLFISIPIISIIFICILIVLIIFTVSLFLKLQKTSKKFEGIEDVDLILQEAKLEQNSSNPKIKINKSLFEINYKDLKLLSILGDGGSLSTIFLAEWNSNYCAYKGFKVSQINDSDQFSFEEFEKEVKIMSSINHPSILQFYGACVNLPNVGIIMQYCSKGDLNKYISKFRLENKISLGLFEKIRLLKEIATGMQYLHSINVLHRDLKPENVLIDDNDNAKIMDFGLSKITKNEEKTQTSRIGTSYYMAPEVIQGGKYSNKCDVYSFAILCYVVVTENFFPYGMGSMNRNILQKVSSSSSFRPKIEKESFENCEFLVELIKKNWNHEPKERSSFKEIILTLKNHEKSFKKENTIKVTPKSSKSQREIELEKEIAGLKNTIKNLKKKYEK